MNRLSFCLSGMKRMLFGGVILSVFGAITARSKPDPLTFVFLRVDPAQDVAYLPPMIAPNIGVQLDSGPRELLLDCGDHKFVVKGLDFTQRAK